MKEDEMGEAYSMRVKETGKKVLYRSSKTGWDKTEIVLEEVELEDVDSSIRNQNSDVANVLIKLDGEFLTRRATVSFSRNLTYRASQLIMEQFSLDCDVLRSVLSRAEIMEYLHHAHR
jgi:hypothetical protein